MADGSSVPVGGGQGPAEAGSADVLFGLDLLEDGAFEDRWWAADHLTGDAAATIDGRPAHIYEINGGVTAFTANVDAAYRSDLDFINATRRRPDWSNPRGLTAGDAVHLRWLAGSLGPACRDLIARRNPAERMGGVAQLLMSASVHNAELHWLTAPVTEALLDSDPPPDDADNDIRLPYRRCTVTFPPVHLDGIEQTDLPVASSDDTGVTTTLAGRIRFQALVGVAFAARPDGTVDNQVVWLCSATPSPDVEPFEQWSLIPGRIDRSALGPFARNVAALLSWGAWADPPPLPPQVQGEPGTRTWAKTLRGAAARKAVARGAGTGVHTIAAQPHQPHTSPDPDTAAKRRSPRPHIRRGHWRRIAHGPGRTLRRWEWRPPTVVAAGAGSFDTRIRVYRLNNATLATRPHDSGAA